MNHGLPRVDAFGTDGTRHCRTCARLSQATGTDSAALSWLCSSSNDGTRHATRPHVKSTIAGGAESAGLQLGGALAPLAEGTEDGEGLTLQPLEAMLRAVVFEWHPAPSSASDTAPSSGTTSGSSSGGSDAARVHWMSRSARRSDRTPS
jgi:hypothetical protein